MTEYDSSSSKATERYWHAKQHRTAIWAEDTSRHAPSNPFVHSKTAVVSSRSNDTNHSKHNPLPSGPPDSRSSSRPPSEQVLSNATGLLSRSSRRPHAPSSSSSRTLVQQQTSIQQKSLKHSQGCASSRNTVPPPDTHTGGPDHSHEAESSSSQRTGGWRRNNQAIPPIGTITPSNNTTTMISRSRDYHTYVPIPGENGLIWQVVVPRKGASQQEIDNLPRTPPNFQPTPPSTSKTRPR